MNENLDINLNDVTDGGEPPTDLVGMVSLLGALSDAEREAVLPGFEARVALLTQPRGPASRRRSHPLGVGHDGSSGQPDGPAR